MPAPLFLSGPCEICGQKAFGRNFGVMSCRACAAFFRRAISSNREKRPCKMGNCEILVGGKYQCKKCRLNKCYQMGMDPKKVSTAIISPPLSLSAFLGRPTFILSCEPDKASHIRTIIDVDFLIRKAEEMLGNVPQKPYSCQNSLQKLTLTLESMKSTPVDNPLIRIRSIGKLEFMMIWEHAFLKSVSWFSHFPEFDDLEKEVKLEILKSSWIMWSRLEKMAETAEFRRRRILEKDVFMCGQSNYVNDRESEVDMSWWTNYSKEQMKYYQNNETTCRELVELLLDLEPTDTELCFMLSQLCLHNAGKKCQGRVLEATDKLIELQADSLHEYYVHKLKTPNYSSRLTKLMKINQAIERDMFDRREKNHIARVFNIIAIDFSHPEMFDGY